MILVQIFQSSLAWPHPFADFILLLLVLVRVVFVLLLNPYLGEVNAPKYTFSHTMVKLVTISHVKSRPLICDQKYVIP